MRIGEHLGSKPFITHLVAPDGCVRQKEALIRCKTINQLVAFDIGIISLADTVGIATPEQVFDITNYLVESLPGVEVGVHLHSSPQNWKAKMEAALKAGCKRFDGALKGIGGCPMADDELVGNMNMEWMIQHVESKGIMPALNKEALEESLKIADEIFKRQ